MRLPAGFRVAGVRCGLKNRRNDLGLIVCDSEYPAAGVFTTNQFRASSVDFTRSALAGGCLSAVVVNSGNANCATGEQGVRDTARMASLVAEALSLNGAIAVASTGVIGKHLEMSKVAKGVALATTKLSENVSPFLEAILTTDLVEKWAFFDYESKVVSTPKAPGSAESGASILGVCKGSGMISPNMATMLGFILTDLDLSDFDLSALLRSANDLSFNCLTVDSDTSTNDMVLLIASGASGIKPSLIEAQNALNRVCTELAKQVARDGEGASKLVEVRVTGTEDPARIARTIADSPLVKTAMFGCDPNWGRILAAAGRSGVPLDVTQVRLQFTAGGDDAVVFSEGTPTAFEPSKVSTLLKADHVVIDLWAGEGEIATIYACDLGYGYVRINAEYHT